MSRDELPWPAEELLDAVRFSDWDCECGGDREKVSDFIQRHPTTCIQAYEVLRLIPEEGYRQLCRGFESGFAGALDVLGNAELFGPIIHQRRELLRRCLTHWGTLVRDEAQGELGYTKDYEAIPILEAAAETEPNTFLQREMKKTAIRLKRDLAKTNI
jgi:hypothetical protein